MTTQAIGLPLSDEAKKRILADVERRARASGYFDFEEPTQTPPRSMGYTKPDPCEKIHAAVRDKRLSPGLARSAEELVRAGKFSPSDVDALLAGLARQPIGAIAYTDEE